jgi:small subunit ribosomal protein S9
MADDERQDENAEREDENAERPGEAPAEEPAGREVEDKPEEVQGAETVVEDDSEDRPGPDRRSEAPGAELEPIAIEPERELSAEERARLEAEAEERAKREAEATAEATPEETLARNVADLPAETRIQATGKRKSSIARVILRAGDGDFEVNDRSLDEYFPRPYLRALARQPLLTAGYEGAVDVLVRVHGGGISGQAGAVRHGIARALCEVDPELRGELKRRGLLTRDSRSKERRKAGLKKARKRPQFSKR